MKKRLKICYLTNLDISRVYKYAIAILNNSNLALKETELVIQGFASAVKDNEKLFIYYSEKKPDWEFVIPYKDYPKELFLILRSKDSEESPGILHIISKDVAEKAFKIIEERLIKADRIDKENIRKYVGMLKAKLKRIINQRHL